MRLLPAILVFMLAAAAAAQPSRPAAPPPPKPPTLTPQPAVARVEATVLLIGCGARFLCGVVAARQEVALVVTKVSSGPLKVGDTPVVGIMTCSPDPLFSTPTKDAPWLELDQRKIRRGSKIDVELEIYADGQMTTPDKIRVLAL
jgi:hypothetical protein